MGTPLTPLERGRQWELEFMARCQERGYTVEDCTEQRVAHDCLVNGKRVQCKSLSWQRPKRHTPHARITRGGTGAARRYRLADVDAFALQINGRVYIVPASRLASKRRRGYVLRAITAHTARHWQERWALLE